MSKSFTSNREKQVAALALCIEAGIPVHWQGDPGIGKTAVINAVAAMMKRSLTTIIASLREPADFGGYPVPAHNEQGSTLEFLPIGQIKRASDTDGIIFLDEVTCTSPRTQAALLRLVHERYCGDFKLSDGVTFVLASNPAEQAAGGFDIAGPLANRMVHMHASVDANQWCDGMVSGFTMPQLPQVKDDWRKLVPEMRSIIASFIHTFPTKLLMLPKAESEMSGAWPSPRTWDMAATLMAACKSAGVNGEIQTELLAGCVGPGAALEFLTWFKDLDMPDPEALIKDPDSFKLPERLDKAYAVLTSISAAVIANLTIPRWNAGLKIMANAAKQGSPDVAAAAAKQLAENRPKGAPAPAEAAVFLPLFQKAGLFPTAR